jgi:hypothetical protein
VPRPAGRLTTFLIAMSSTLLLSVIQTAGGHADEAARSSPNLEMVARIGGIGGTDIEMFSRTLDAYQAPDGSMVAPEQPTERHFAFVGSSGPARIVDITDPTQPYVVAAMQDCSISQGDPQVTADGMLAAIAKQGTGTCRIPGGAAMSSGGGSALVDLANVYNPVVIGVVNQTGGSHNHTIHPSGEYLYISPSTAFPGGPGNSTIPIWDISNPRAPKFVKNFTAPGDGPHDVRFSPDGKRAYVAAVSTYYILNTENPENPTLISIMVPPTGTIGHDTLVTPDKAFLFLGDEAGGGVPYPCPGGAIFAYDIRDETKPLFLGLAEAGGGPVFARAIDEAPPAGLTAGACTSHVMELNPDKRSLTLGWYSLGTRTFSFASFYNADGSPKPGPQIAAAWGKNGVGLVETGWIIPDSSSTWAAKQYANVPGYIFSNAGGSGGGLYVTRIKAPGY